MPNVGVEAFDNDSKQQIVIATTTGTDQIAGPVPGAMVILFKDTADIAQYRDVEIRSMVRRIRDIIIDRNLLEGIKDGTYPNGVMLTGELNESNWDQVPIVDPVINFFDQTANPGVSVQITPTMGLATRGSTTELTMLMERMWEKLLEDFFKGI